MGSSHVQGLRGTMGGRVTRGLVPRFLFCSIYSCLDLCTHARSWMTGTGKNGYSILSYSGERRRWDWDLTGSHTYNFL